MLLQELVSPKVIKVGLESEDKEEVFEELVDVMVAGYGAKDDRADILRAVREREAKMSTGIRRGIAIPHGLSQKLSGVRIAIGVSRAGVDYDALDGEPVFLVFLLAAPADQSEEYLRILRRLAVLLENQEFIDELARSRTAADAFHIVQKFETMLIHQA